MLQLVRRLAKLREDGKPQNAGVAVLHATEGHEAKRRLRGRGSGRSSRLIGGAGEGLFTEACGRTVEAPGEGVGTALQRIQVLP
jgi:hypothetical protein